MAFGKLSSLLDRPPLIDSPFRPKIYLALCCFLILAWGSWKGWSTYQEKQEARLVETAETLFKNKDWRGASLAARRALYLHKNLQLDLRATEIMAAISREFQLPQEIYWRSELVRLLPASPKAKEDLIQTAIRHNSLTLAGNTLESIPPDQRKNSSFHRLMAIYAIARKEPAYAEAALREALKLEPNSADIQRDLAKVLMAYGKPETYPEALNLINSLPSSPEKEADILRSKIEASKLKGELSEALTLSNRLLNLPKANFNDKIINLTLLFSFHSPNFKESLTNLQKETAPYSPLVYQLASWLRGNGMARDALQWLDTFPEESRFLPPLSVLWAECAAAAGEWKAMGKTLRDQDWGETESLRLAFLAKVEQESGANKSLDHSSQLQKSLTLANANPALSLTLGDLFLTWSWNEQAKEAWWQAARSAQSKLALGKLFELYKNEKDLNGIWRVSKVASELDPSDLIARNNFAMTSLILGKGVDAAAVSSRDLYLKYPDIPAFASTFGFALSVQKKKKEALEVFQKLPPSLLQDAGVAPYYVLVLAQNKRFQEADQYRAYVQPASLFPEEFALYQQAEQPE